MGQHNYYAPINRLGQIRGKSSVFFSDFQRGLSYKKNLVSLECEIFGVSRTVLGFPLS